MILTRTDSGMSITYHVQKRPDAALTTQISIALMSTIVGGNKNRAIRLPNQSKMITQMTFDVYLPEDEDSICNELLHSTPTYPFEHTFRAQYVYRHSLKSYLPKTKRVADR